MASAKIIQYTSKTLKDGTHPIVLLITHDYKRKKISMGFSCSKDLWDKQYNQFKSNFPNYKKRNRILQKSLFRAEDIIEKFQDSGKIFSIKDFEEKFIGIQSKDVFTFFEAIIKSLNETGKIGNGNIYRDARNALQKFYTGKALAFNEIDYSFLKRFEEHLRKRGMMDNSISVYMRTIRALFNKAIKEKQCSQEYYPFKEYQISKLKNETTPRAISKEAIIQIKNFVPDPNTKQELSKHLFLFSFYTNGMNFSDIALLKWENIHAGRISYFRSKTKKRFSIKILPPVQEVLDFYKQINPSSKYIFPILDESYKTPVAIKNRTKSGLKRLNKHLKIIGLELNISTPLTSYVARHSYATVLKKSGISTSIISENMGHQSEKVTQIYLDNFENETLDKANEALL